MKCKYLILTLACCCGLGRAAAQHTRSLSENIHTVRLVVDNDPLLPPVTRMGGSVNISFDDLTHEYERYIYKVQLCNADWSVNEDLFESDWLEGFNGRPIEDYETSLNTSVLYTHYRLLLPNDDVRLLVPGNYRVLICPEDNDDEPVCEASFSLLSPEMGIAAEVLTNTDVLDKSLSTLIKTYDVKILSGKFVCFDFFAKPPPRQRRARPAAQHPP